MHTVESIQKQTFDDFQIIACDNASTDETPQILDDLIRQGLPLRVVRHSEDIGWLRNFIGAAEQAIAPASAVKAVIANPADQHVGHTRARDRIVVIGAGDVLDRHERVDPVADAATLAVTGIQVDIHADARA